MNWTEQELQAYLAKTGQAAPAPKRPSKYNARRTWADGIPFDSQKEADYYAGLKMLCRAGEIAGFLYHGKMVVAEGTGPDQRAALYEPDFVLLHPNGRYEIVDTKGVETDVFKLKMKALRERYPGVKVEKR